MYEINFFSSISLHMFKIIALLLYDDDKTNEDIYLSIYL